ncbi:MAG: translation initiation factor IF-2 [Candidatus Woesearchaeota archaeon]|jgi:translation initiation factor 5B|nr:translation initiation factor IF-2 [Candidatus Woesearchaeota archaeon]MDP7181615.1 translation initiation factor IF-2 [Candidatus Woesearchaeota archaeon]MDP7198917.1 translation initiation factor IF-2 [Candidatus Woesearchaeota archaeon]MDP7467296.1 translation initiation factor IF-2 [Candidatus Woesearchaeota archaeon]MDP7647912.1 translation initiation factor IF-2 [Candidatus Woesearchaeota archaeon]
MIRQPIVTIMGHVDHGKTRLLDKIRGSAVQEKEAGGITQAIGASIIDSTVLEKICKPLLKAMSMELTIPGLLFVDTPGHAAFVNLRKRGGNLADIAILVVDINEGPMEQTMECVKVLKEYKIPFVVALNKIDLIKGWKNDITLGEAVRQAIPSVQKIFETKLYETIGKLYELGFEAERYDRIEDHTKTLAVIPVSAETGQGIPELLMTVAGLAQRFLGDKLITTDIARGTVLEIQDQKGVGKVVDAIIYDGSIKQGQTIVMGGVDKPVVAKIKALFQPAPMQEMRVAKFKPVKEVFASTGVRILCPKVEAVAAGMPIIAGMKEAQAVKEVEKQVREVLIETDKEGVIAKADSLGSLEALVMLLKSNDIPVKKAGIGDITKKDLTDADSMKEKNSLHAVVLGFNVSKQEGALTNDVIYRLIDAYKAWADKQKKRIEMEKLNELVKPCKILVMKGYVFRQNNPAIVGVQVEEGELRNNIPLMDDKGKHITTLKGIQQEKKQVDHLKKGDKGAASLPEVTVGRQVSENQILYSEVSEEQFLQYKEFKETLTEDDKKILKDIANIMRENNPVWGV